MHEQDEQVKAAEALAMVRTHEERARRAARLPWWVYAGMFVLTAGGMAANDFVDLNSSKVISGLVLVALVVVLVTGIGNRSAPLSRVRAVQRRQSFVPSVFVVVAIVAGLGAWLISQYGAGFAGDVAGAVGLGDYPDTVAGVLFGAAFTLLFGLSQLLLAASHERTSR